MSPSQDVLIRQLTPNQAALLEAMSKTFGEAFDDVDTYAGNRPSAAYLERLLGSDYFIALAASKGEEVVGGIAAYELLKFEQQRSEIYIYDLAVAVAHRRQGIATRLIRELEKIAAGRGAHVIFVQADVGDEPAIGLYTKLGVREDVLHFDIPVGDPSRRAAGQRGPTGAWSRLPIASGASGEPRTPGSRPSADPRSKP